jgi:hypothetical protein
MIEGWSGVDARGGPDTEPALDRYRPRVDRLLRQVLKDAERAGIDCGRSARALRAWSARPPMWLLIPVWLDKEWTSNSPGGHRSIRHIIWAQYALFLSIRLRDDLLDGHTSDLRLQFVADRLVAEALESFERVPELDRRFRTAVARLLAETAGGILDLRYREAIAGSVEAADLVLHTRVGAVFAIGAIAVCHLHGRYQDAEWLERLIGELCVIGQIHDDLKDLIEDVRVRRFTYVANVLLGYAPGMALDEQNPFDRLGAGISRPSASDPIWQALEAACDAACRAIPVVAPARIRDYVASLRPGHAELRAALHEAGVRLFFGDELTVE